MNTNEDDTVEATDLHHDDESACKCCGSRWYMTDVDGSKAYVHNA